MLPAKGREQQRSQRSIASLADSHTEFFDACEVFLSASSSENEVGDLRIGVGREGSAKPNGTPRLGAAPVSSSLCSLTPFLSISQPRPPCPLLFLCLFQLPTVPPNRVFGGSPLSEPSSGTRLPPPAPSIPQSLHPRTVPMLDPPVLSHTTNLLHGCPSHQPPRWVTPTPPAAHPTVPVPRRRMMSPASVKLPTVLMRIWPSRWGLDVPKQVQNM